MDTEIGKIASLMNATKEKDTSSGESGPVLRTSGGGDHGHLCHCIRLKLIPEDADSRLSDVCRGAGRGGDSEALSSIVNLVQAMGTQKMARETLSLRAEGGRESGVRLCYLFR